MRKIYLTRSFTVNNEKVVARCRRTEDGDKFRTVEMPVDMLKRITGKQIDFRYNSKAYFLELDGEMFSED